MKFISWNVNGLRACLKKGFGDFFTAAGADVFCVQETKLQGDDLGQVFFGFDGYFQYWNHALKKGYSGTAVFSRKKPAYVNYGIGVPDHDREGRVVTLEYDTFFLVNVYTPNSKPQLERLSYRMVWEDDLRLYLKKLDALKPVVMCGDLNVAHNEIDLKNPSSNRGNAGFTDEERGKFNDLLKSGFIDSFRMLYPERTGAYTWWSYIYNARATNAGWRIDYFCVSERLAPKVKEAGIHDSVPGSDHCPVELVLDLP